MLFPLDQVRLVRFSSIATRKQVMYAAEQDH